MRLVSRPLRHPTCPLCRESVFLLETSTCEGCRTDYHQVCLAEFTGCSTLGCASTNYVETNFTLTQRATSSESGIRVTPRAAAPSMAWIRWIRLRAAIKAAIVRARIRDLDLTLVGLVGTLGLILVMFLVFGIRELAQSVSLSDWLGVGLAGLALGGVVLGANVVGSRR